MPAKPKLAARRRARSRLAAAVFVFPALALPAISVAGDRDWLANSGNWNTPGNWSPTGVPIAGDAVYILNANLLLDQVNYDYTGAAIAIGSLEVSNTGGGLDVLNITTTGQSLTSQYETLGGFFFGDSSVAGKGTINQSTGTNSVNTLDIGFFAKDQGVYNFSSTATLSMTTFSSELSVGLFGTGAFTQSGGRVAISGASSNLTIAFDAGAVGTYTMTGGSLTLAVSPQGNGEYVGYGGNGAFNQSGGVNRLNNNGFLYVGYNAGATGTYTLSGTGLLSVDGVENIGYNGVAIFNQSGGTNSLESDQGIFGFYLGRNAGSTGTYIFSAGSLGASSSASEYIGYSGAGFFNQTGGTHTIDRGANMYLAFSAGATASYSLSGGFLTLSGGNSDLIVAEAANSTASFTLSGTATLTIAGTTQAGGLKVGKGGHGTFIQSGGALLINGSNNYFAVGIDATSTSSYSLSAGLLSTGGAEFLGVTGAGVFTQTGGSNVFTRMDQGIFGLDVGGFNGGNGVYNLVGPGTLSSVATESILNGIFNQSDGLNVLTTHALLNIGTGADSTKGYNLTGGTLLFNSSNAAEQINGYFNQSGGIHLIATGDTLSLGGFFGTGTYILSNGSLSSAGNESVGDHGIGILNQTGGVNNVTSAASIAIGVNSGSFGQYAISGGVANVDGSLSVGGSAASPGGQGLLYVFPATVLNINNSLTIWNTPGTTVYLEGGTISTSALDFNGVPANFHWTSGTLKLTAGADFDSSAAITSTADAFGTGLAISSGQELDVIGSEVLGGGGPFTLTLNSGALNSVDGVVVTLNNGALNVAGGTVAVAGSLSTFGPTTLGGSVMTTASQYYNTPVFLSGNGPTLSDPIGPINFYNPVNGASQALTLIAPGGTSFRATSTLGSLLVQSGTVTLVGAITLSAQSEFIGINGAAAFAQSTGVNSMTTFGNSLYVGYNLGDTGTYILSGSGSLFISAGNEFVGYNGVGLFNQSGGTHTVGLGLSLGLGNGASGTYVLSAGSLFAASETLAGSIANPGTANFIQTGGLNSASSLNMAYLANSTATYSLSNTGLLTSVGEVVATSGVAQFTQSGGLHQISGDLDLATAAGSTGTYFLSNTGSLSVQNIYVGGSTGSAGGRGVLTVTNSATMNASGLLKIWNNGRVNLDALFAKVGNLNIAGNGLLNLNGALQINFGTPANDPVVTIVTYLKNGLFNGTSGIISTSVAGTVPAVSIGYADGNTDAGTSAAPNQILLKYTLAGDTNLDGLVNFNDLVAVVQNFNKPNADWAHGDFHFGTSTNFNDLVTVVQNFNKLLPPPSGSSIDLGGTTLPLSTIVRPTDVSLPEPGVLCLAATGTLFLLKRRRKP